MKHPAALTALLLLATLPAAPATGSNPEKVDVIRPGSDGLDLTIMKPFEADYVQMGYTMTVKLMKTAGETPIFGVLMIVDGPGGVGVDSIGHRASDFGFAYRRFDFGRWGREYIDAASDGKQLTVSRMKLPAESGKASLIRKAIDGDFFDGTFAHWIMAMLPFEKGYAASLASWTPTEEDADIYTMPAATMRGPEQVEAVDGTSFTCWVAEIHSTQGIFRNCLSKEPPYLIRQTMIPEGEEPVTVLLVSGKPKP